jgi:hypothetical protein
MNPAPPMAPSWAPVKPNSFDQLSKMPPRMAKPTPAARMAMKPAQRRRFALGTVDVSVYVIGFGVEWELSGLGADGKDLGEKS